MTRNCICYEALVIEVWGVQSTPLLQLLPGPLWPAVEVPVSITSMVQIDMLENYDYSIGFPDTIYICKKSWL